MDHTKKRGLAALLALSMVLGLLAGCGRNKDNAQQLSATVYVPKYIDLGLKLEGVNGACTDGTNIYLIGETEEQTEVEIPGTDETYYNYTYNYDIYRLPLEGGAAEKLPNYKAPAIPEGFEGNCYINGMTVAEDGTLWVTETVDVWGTAGDMYGGYRYDDAFAVDMLTAASSAISYAAPEEEEADTDDAEADTADVIDIDDDFDEKYPDGEYDYEYFESLGTYVRKHLSADGTELGSIDLKQLPEKLGVEWVSQTVFGPEGNIYACVSDDDGNQVLYVLDSGLNIQFSMQMGTDYWGSITPLGDGKACSMNWFNDESTDAYGYKVQMIDFEKQDWGAEYLLPPSAYNIYPGGGDYLFYYQINDAIMGWKDSPDTTEGERLFAWIEADVNSDNIQNFFFLPDGRVAATTREWDNGELNLDVVVMTATPRDQLPEKTTLTFASMYLDYDTRKRIIDFNKTNEKYRIEVKDYSEYATAADYNAGLQKLNTEMIAGVVPDILDTDSLPVQQYAARGYLEDLWTFIDNDPDLSRDKLMVRPLEAGQLSGKLYEVFATFSIQTVVGSRKIVGDRISWTLADLMDALEKMPEGCAIFGEDDTKDGMLRTIVNINMGNFVDWDGGKCYFDSDNFKSLLAFCNNFATEFSYENVDWSEWEDSDTRILTGKQMLAQAYLGNFDWSFQRYNALFPDGLSYVGYPMEDGSVGSCFNISGGMAISSTCKDKDGAWSFVRQILLAREDEERYYYGGFPVNKADFDKMVENAMTPQYYTDENGDPYLDENGEPIISNLNSIWISDGTQIDCHLPTQEEVDRFMDLYNSITTVNSYDTDIFEIITDVAGAYFAGDRNLDDTAGLIQNRVNTYVNERK